LKYHHINSDIERRPGKKRRAIFENKLQNYLLEGGFPEVQSVKKENMELGFKISLSHTII